MKNYFFCYNNRLSAFLRYKGLEYITKAINPKTNLMFSLYLKSNELQQAIDEYKANNQEK